MSDNQTISKLEKGSPFLAYQYVDVEFTEPNQYVRVFHKLYPEDPYSIRYIVVAKDKDCTISDNRTDPLSTDAWTKSWIVLKSNQAPAMAELLLTVKKNA